MKPAIIILNMWILPGIITSLLMPAGLSVLGFVFAGGIGWEVLNAILPELMNTLSNYLSVFG